MFSDNIIIIIKILFGVQHSDS